MQPTTCKPDTVSVEETRRHSRCPWVFSEYSRPGVLEFFPERLNTFIGTLQSRTFDTNKDGKVSYEEIKRDILRTTDGFTLKQVFKTVDYDKDFYLTADEYLALLDELEVRQKGPRYAKKKCGLGKRRGHVSVDWVTVRKEMRKSNFTRNLQEGNLSTAPKTIEMAETMVTPRTQRRERVSSGEETPDNTVTSSSSSSAPSVLDSSSVSSAERVTTTADESVTESTLTDNGDRITSETTPTSEASSVTEILIREARSVEKGANIDSSSSDSPKLESSSATTSEPEETTTETNTEDSSAASTATEVAKKTTAEPESKAVRKLTAVQVRSERKVEKGLKI
ncbi:EF hand [Teladorsagia circumcincta]|uniref:EF hand n=1 Tax=Teladorsagia circumcincta TaxID=45464 RepID=A0A2G9UYR1_TELCI|nr:EF hand [Teladorsagia circumcincta]